MANLELIMIVLKKCTKFYISNVQRKIKKKVLSIFGHGGSRVSAIAETLSSAR